MNPTGICELIKACADSGVAELTWGGLHVQFSCQNRKKELESLTNVDYAPNNSERTTENPLDGGVTEEFRTASLLLTNPVEYEEELLNN